MTFVALFLRCKCQRRKLLRSSIGNDINTILNSRSAKTYWDKVQPTKDALEAGALQSKINTAAYKETLDNTCQFFLLANTPALQAFGKNRIRIIFFALLSTQ